MKIQRMVGLVLGLLLLVGAGVANAAPTFYATSDPVGHWYVSTNVGGADGQLSSFNTAGFVQATSVAGRPGWIANNSSGTNGGVGTWTFFVFRQQFDLTGYDPKSATLQFQWAADDSGEGYAMRGTWTPKFSLNGGAFVPYPGSPTPTYGLSSTVFVTSGFTSGINTIDFYVEGNGVSDGFALQDPSLSAKATPIPAAAWLLGTGVAGLAALRRRFKA